MDEPGRAPAEEPHEQAGLSGFWGLLQRVPLKGSIRVYRILGFRVWIYKGL